MFCLKEYTENLTLNNLTLNVTQHCVLILHGDNAEIERTMYA
jgi:hypothetical protein